jgi:hypothetical protein
MIAAEKRGVHKTRPCPAGFLLLFIAAAVCAVSSYAYADSDEEIENLRDLVTVFQDGDQNVIQNIELSNCILTVTTEYSCQYLYPKDVKTIQYGYQRTINRYDAPLGQMNAGSIEIVSDKAGARVMVCTEGERKIIRHTSLIVFYDGKSIGEKSSLEPCFEIQFPAVMDIGQQIKKSLKNLIDRCD